MVFGGSPECNKTSWNSNKNAYTRPPDCQKNLVGTSRWGGQSSLLIGIICKNMVGTVLTSSHVPAALYYIGRHILRHMCTENRMHLRSYNTYVCTLSCSRETTTKSEKKITNCLTNQIYVPRLFWQKTNWQLKQKKAISLLHPMKCEKLDFCT